jgi:hypothetical protein
MSTSTRPAVLDFIAPQTDVLTWSVDCGLVVYYQISRNSHFDANLEYAPVQSSQIGATTGFFKNGLCVLSMRADK